MEETGGTSVDQILGDLAPLKSASAYKKAWTLADYIQHGNKPSEEVFILYFHHLHTDKNLSASTRWSIYDSMLNAHLKRFYGEQLQHYSRLTILFERYNEEYSRKKYEIFTWEQLQEFL